MSNFPFLGWREVDGPWFQAMAPISVVGDVRPSTREGYVGKWWWCARVKDDCRVESKAPQGYALTKEGAMAIVEAILFATGTVDGDARKKEPAKIEVVLAHLVAHCDSLRAAEGSEFGFGVFDSMQDAVEDARALLPKEAAKT